MAQYLPVMTERAIQMCEGLFAEFKPEPAFAKRAFLQNNDASSKSLIPDSKRRTDEANKTILHVHILW